MHRLALVLVGLSLSAGAVERLGRDVVPTFQAVRLELDARKADYTGSVRIELRVHRPVPAFRFHAKEMTFTRLDLRGPAGPVSVTHAPVEDGGIRVTAPRPLAPGVYTLEVDFTNNIDTRSHSLFKVQTGGNAYTFTQFEPDAAREAFPCWDEPDFKIPFEVTLVVPHEHQAFSNTPVERETASGSTKTLVFRQTKPIPSYLVALATGPFETVPVPGMTVPGRVITPRGQANLAAEAAAKTPPILAALERYFGRPYPYEKLDLIAVPGFGGAMENVGLVTFNDSLLLLDSARATAAQRASLAAVMAHELAHMWFGNLVTMRWWDDVWLNESFASWMGAKIANEVFPQYEVDVGEVPDAHFAMRTDARLATRAVRQPVYAGENLMLSFDEIAYPKGERVLRMFERWIGPERFRRGVIAYLQSHEWRNATAADLFRALSQASGRDVGRAMSTFLDQPGVPLVTAHTLPAGRLRLQQRRFLNYGTQAPGPARWEIPITIKLPAGSETATQNIFLTTPATTVRLNVATPPVWVHPNAFDDGYYRWKVPIEMLDAMARDSSTALEVRERIGFIENLSALLDAGALEGRDYLKTLSLFADDPDPGVIAALLGALNKVRVAFVPQPDATFAQFVQTTLAPAVARWGWRKTAGEPETVSLLRPKLMGWLAEHGNDENVQWQAQELARAYLADASSVDPALAAVALRLAAMRGNAALFETYRQRFEAAKVPADRDRFLGALAGFRDPELIEKALEYAIEGPLRPTEIFTIPFGVGLSERWEDRRFEWLVANYDKVTAKVPPYTRARLPSLAGGCSPERLARARKFFAEPAHQAPGLEKQLAKVAESVSDCAKLRERERGAVEAYLRSP